MVRLLLLLVSSAWAAGSAADVQSSCPIADRACEARSEPAAPPPPAAASGGNAMLQTAAGPTKKRAAPAGDEEAHQTLGAWPACLRSCAAPAVAFQPESEEALSLFRGCNPSEVNRSAPPALIVLGAQKGGTTSLLKLVVRSKDIPSVGLCAHRSGEAHWWDKARFRNAPPSIQDMPKYYQGWQHCGENQVLFEKSPNYLVQPWTPRRLCEHMGRHKLAVLLRNPIDRAYSGYYQQKRVRNESATPEEFNLLARMEISLVESCSPSALRWEPSGDDDLDKEKASSYYKCCKGIAKRFQQDPSAVCTCSPVDGKDYKCDPSNGMKDFYVIREGIYVHHLQLWLKYYRAQDMLIVRSEDFFDRMPDATAELACFAQSASSGCSAKGLNSTSTNSAVRGHPKMLDETHQLLKDFYTPYNRQLDALMGRSMSWW